MKRQTMMRYQRNLSEISDALEAIKMAFEVDEGPDMQRMAHKVATAESAVSDAGFDLLDILAKKAD